MVEINMLCPTVLTSLDHYFRGSKKAAALRCIALASASTAVTAAAAEEAHFWPLKIVGRYESGLEIRPKLRTSSE